MEGVGRLGWCAVDCADPLRLAAFWSEVLGMQIDEGYLGDPPHYVGLIPATPGGPAITFNRVPEPKTVKRPRGQRVLPDLRVGLKTVATGSAGGVS
jgi:hypothetical protein